MTEIEWKMLTIVHTKMYESNNTTKGKTAQFQTTQKENNPSLPNHHSYIDEYVKIYRSSC
jgi:hypothetical protein